MSSIEVVCNGCTKAHQFAISDLEYELIGSEERQMGAELTYEATNEIECFCGQAIEIIHRYWEYPEGMENDQEIEVEGATLKP